METVKKNNIKNRTYYFYNDIINLENFDSNLLKLDKKSNKDIGIYNIGYITIISNIVNTNVFIKNIYSVNPLYLRITRANGCIERSSAEEINEK